MPDTSTATVAPPLLPPLLEVGYNSTWPLNRYGISIGPRDLKLTAGAVASVAKLTLGRFPNGVP